MLSIDIVNCSGVPIPSLNKIICRHFAKSVQYDEVDVWGVGIYACDNHMQYVCFFED